MKLIFEEEIHKDTNKRILSFINTINDLSNQEKDQLKLIVLWESIETFDEKRGCLFTTHLYNRCRYAYLKHINKKKMKVSDSIDKSYQNNLCPLKELPENHKKVLEERFVYKYTISEMMKIHKKNKKEVKLLIENAQKSLQEYLDK